MLGEVNNALDRIEHLVRDGGRIHLDVSIALFDILVLKMLRNVSDCKEMAETVLEIHLLALYVDHFPGLLLALLIRRHLVDSLFRRLVVSLCLIKDVDQSYPFRFLDLIIGLGF